MHDRPELLGLDDAALTAALGGPGRALMVLKSLARGEDPTKDPEVPASLQRRVAATTRYRRLPVRARTEAEDGTRKLLLGLEDGHAVECVLIPERDRTTLCVSSQVGCRRGCQFCMTATMGLVRHLRVAEILGQVHTSLSEQAGLPPLRNVVFMGMGEPLDNPKAVQAALSALTDSRGYGVAPKHVTISTVAPSPAALARSLDWPGQLAWSLHAADDPLRRRLVPTQRHSVFELRDAVLARQVERRQALFVEITLLDGVNDAPEHARAAADLFEGSEVEIRFNLLPMNPGAAGLGPSPEARVEAFEAVLRDHGYFVHRRKARGQAAKAACGQLAILDATA